jgi:Diadenosine tetraphosphate (Ap4A) hydrolase and other HIT family hydrolases
MGVAHCLPCENNARVDDLPVRERIVVHGGWRLVHAFGVELPGWLCLIPMRHIEAMNELSAEEAASLGPLLRASSAALHDVVGCAKTYVVLYAEHAAYPHLHFHVIPRASDLAPELRGPAIFGLMGQREIPEAERDRIAIALRPRVQEALD